MRGGRGAEAAAAERERANGPGCGGGGTAMPGPSPPRGLRCEARWDETGMGRGQWSCRGCTGWVTPCPCPFPRGLPGLRGLSTAQPLLFSLWTLFFSSHPLLPSVLQTPKPRLCFALLCPPRVSNAFRTPWQIPSPQWVIKIVKTLTSLITAGPELPGRRDSLSTARQCNSPRRCC